MNEPDVATTRPLSLRLLGTADLRNENGDELRSVLVAPKRLVLLAYLALTAPSFQRRDVLLALLWPELTTERARQALRSLLHKLRQGLGDGVIASRGDDELALDLSRIRSDVTDFRAAVADRRFADAMRLYGGDLLEGFHVSGLPEAERWLDEQRAALRSDALVATRALADDAARSERWRDVVDASKRGLALDPTDESAIRHLMAAYDRLGDRAAALAAYIEFERRLRGDYDAEPSPSTAGIAQSMREKTPPGAQHAHRHTPSVPPALRNLKTRFARARVAVEIAIVVALAGLVVFPELRGNAESREPAPDVDRIAVLPFEVDVAGGSADYLRDGVARLIADGFTGDGGPIAVSSRARSELLVRGSVVGTTDRLIVSAQVVDRASGDPLGTAQVVGPATNLPALVEGLTKRLLAFSAREDRGHLDALSNVSLGTERLYLDGVRYFRRGAYTQAATAYGRALQADSNFALAALGLVVSGNLIQPTDPHPFFRGRRLLWRTRERLSPRDRAFADAIAGAHFPERDDLVDRLAAAERLVHAAPERADAWFRLGDVLYHFGREMETGDAQGRARAAFRIATLRDSGLAAALDHLLAIAIERGDTVTVRTLAARYERLHSRAEAATYVRWRVALALGDSGGVQRVRVSFDTASFESLIRIAGLPQIDGVGMSDAPAAARAAIAHAATPDDRFFAYSVAHDLALNRGRVDEARTLADSAARVAPPSAPGEALHAADALYADGDLSDAGRGAAALAAMNQEPHLLGARVFGQCISALAREYAGDVSSADRNAHSLRSLAPDDDQLGLRTLGVVCAALVEARRAVMERLPRATSVVTAADSMIRRGPAVFPTFLNLELSRLYTALGDVPAARAALARRANHLNYARYLATYLVEEERLAELANDRPAAAAAHRHYLALRGRKA